MAKVVQLEIFHFRKFEKFKCTFGMRNLVCLIGRGDSGKTSILEALGYVLSPTRLVQLSDYDFTECKTETPIRIRATVVEMEENLLRADKYGYHQCGWDSEKNRLCGLEQEGSIPALIVELTVDSSLEPKWEVENPVSGERKTIGFKDRALFNVSLVSDYLNRHFAWANGSPLASLTTQVVGEGLDQGVLQEISRSVRNSANGMSFGDLDGILTAVADRAGEFGLETGKLSPAFDIKQMAIRDGAVCLHDERKLPLRLRGKGSKRLLSAAIQSAVAGNTGITLIDEVEQGLEPDRVRSFVHTLARGTKGQVFMTTHSQNVLVEVSAENIFWMRKDRDLESIPSAHQALIRSYPGAFFGRKIVLCEGKTELGICKAIDEFLNERDKLNFSRAGVVLVMGRGNNFKKTAEAFLELGVQVLLFCDSDVPAQNEWKDELSEKGVPVVSWDDGDSVEEGVLKDIPDEAVSSLLGMVASQKYSELDGILAEQRICDAVRRQGGPDNVDCLFRAEVYDQNLRKAIGKAAKDGSDAGKWFKSEFGGLMLGGLLCRYGAKMSADCRTIKNIASLVRWMKDA